MNMPVEHRYTLNNTAACVTPVPDKTLLAKQLALALPLSLMSYPPPAGLQLPGPSDSAVKPRSEPLRGGSVQQSRHFDRMKWNMQVLSAGSSGLVQCKTQ